MPQSVRLDVVIVGAGPAGLSAGLACLHNDASFCVLEQGPPLNLRSHDDALNVGVGGAGLYSDGKFSFFPSASNLWKLTPSATLKRSYNAIARLSSGYGIIFPPFPEHAQYRPLSVEKNLEKKMYQSVYASLETRLKLIAELENKLGLYLRSHAVLRDFTVDDCVRLNLINGLTGEVSELESKVIIFATGKLGPLEILRNRRLPRVFRRVEAGVRIEQPASKFFLKDEPSLDPKLIISSDTSPVKWRTFCCCRNGENVSIVYDDITIVSGRSDVYPTLLSNVGFLARVEADTEDVVDDLLTRLRTNSSIESAILKDVLSCDQIAKNGLYRSLGSKMGGFVTDGLRELVRLIGVESFEDAVVVSPVLEGVGFYPAIGQNLQVGTDPVWVAGDAGGGFRGLVAALVSGYFAGAEAVESCHEKR